MWTEAIPLDPADGYVKSLRKAGGVASHCTIPVIRCIALPLQIFTHGPGTYCWPFILVPGNREALQLAR